MTHRKIRRMKKTQTFTEKKNCIFYLKRCHDYHINDQSWIMNKKKRGVNYVNQYLFNM